MKKKRLIFQTNISNLLEKSESQEIVRICKVCFGLWSGQRVKCLTLLIKGQLKINGWIGLDGAIKSNGGGGPSQCSSDCDTLCHVNFFLLFFDLVFFFLFAFGHIYIYIYIYSLSGSGGSNYLHNAFSLLG